MSSNVPSSVPEVALSDKLVAGFLAFKEAGIFFDKFQFLYDALIYKPEYVDELGLGFQSLIDAGFLYNAEFKPLYDALSHNPKYADKLGQGFQILKAAGLFYDAESKPLYDALIREPKYADKLGLAFQKLKEAGFPYSIELQPLYDVFFAEFIRIDPWIVTDFTNELLEKFTRFKEAGVTCDEFQFFYEALYHAPKYTINKLQERFLKLRKAGFSYAESKPLYDKIYTVSTEECLSYFFSEVDELIETFTSLKDAGFPYNAESCFLYDAIYDVVAKPVPRSALNFFSLLNNECVQKFKMLKEAGFSCNAEYQFLYEALIHHPLDAVHLIKNFRALEDGGFPCNAEYKPLYEAIIYKPDCANDFMRGFQILHSAEFPYGAEFKPLYDVLIQERWHVSTLATGFKALNEAGLSYNAEFKPLYDALIKHPREADKLVIGFKTLTEIQFPYPKFKALYEVFIKYPGAANELAEKAKQWFAILEEAGFPYEGFQSLYHALIEHSKYAYILATGFKALKEMGFPYCAEFKPLYDALDKHCRNTDKLIIGFKALKEADFSYAEFKFLYDKLADCAAWYPDRLGAGCRVLKEAGFLYAEFKFLYDALIDSRGHAYTLGIGIKALKDAGFLYGEFQFFYDAIIKNFQWADKLGIGFQILKDAEFSYNEFQFLYRALIEKPQYADNLATVFKVLKEAGVFYDKNPGPYHLVINNTDEDEFFYSDLAELIQLFVRIGIKQDTFPDLFEKHLFINQNKLVLHAFRECEKLGFSLRSHRFVYNEIIKNLNSANYHNVLEAIHRLSDYKKTLLEEDTEAFNEQCIEVKKLFEKSSAHLQKGPLVKTQSTYEVEETLRILIHMNPKDICIYYNEFGHYIFQDRQSALEINLSLLFRNANLSHLTLSDDFIIEMGEFIRKIFPEQSVPDTTMIAAILDLLQKDHPNYDDSENQKMKTIACIWGQAFSLYTAYKYKNINGFFRSEALALQEQYLFYPKESHEKEPLMCFLLGCLIADAENKMNGYEVKNEPITDDAKNPDNEKKICLGRVEALTAEEVQARVKGYYALPALTSYSFFRKGSPFILKGAIRPNSKKVITTLTIPPHFFDKINPSEKEIIVPGGTILETSEVTSGEEVYLVSTIVRSPSVQAKDHCWSECALAYATENHLSKPYSDPKANHPILMGNKIITRPNHNVTHVYRGILVIELVIEYFSLYAKDEKFKEFCLSITPREIEWLRVAAAFSITGRDSEIKKKEDPSLYDKYRAVSAGHFNQFLSKTVKHFDVLNPKKDCDDSNTLKQRLSDVVRYMGNPNYHKPDSPDSVGNPCNPIERQKRIFYHHILTIAHKLDLARCYSVDEYNDAMRLCRDLSVENSEQKYAYEAILRYNIELIKAHGGALKCDITPDGKLVNTHLDYQAIYAESSRSIKRLFDISQTVEKPAQCFNESYGFRP